jgi:tRNA(Ile)-lysidine synthase
MARSRNSAEEALRAALGLPAVTAAPWGIAFSGGLDSTVLLHAAVAVLGPASVVALHVHHHLQAPADDWARHCAQQAEALGVGFDLLHAQGAPAAAESIEAWARTQRYGVLLDAARRRRLAGVMTGHHADDQLETVLLAWARGSGIDGLAGIAPRDCREGVTLLRPLLTLPRAALHEAAQAGGWVAGIDWIEDPSNEDERWPRNAVRHRLLPVLREVLPGLPRQLPAALDKLREARAIVHERAREDLARARIHSAPGHALDRRCIVDLGHARAIQLLRQWLRDLGTVMPTQARLEAMVTQLLQGAGPYGEVRHEHLLLWRHRDRLMAWEASARVSAPALRALPAWNGTSSLDLGEQGTLHGRPVATGLPPDWLAAQSLVIGPMPTATRVRPMPGRPARTLKNLWQEAAIPAFVRSGFPGLWCDQALLLAAPFGMDRSVHWPQASPGIELVWSPPPEGLLAAFCFDAGWSNPERLS